MAHRVKAALWLFDIDGTLVDTGGAGMRALQDAAFQCFGGTGPELDLAGSTDLGVLANILAHFGLEESPDHPERFFSTYLALLEANLACPSYVGRALPGAPALLESLNASGTATLGLLTGNIADGAAAKVRRHGMDSYFDFGAYGCDNADRNLLGPLALERAHRVTGRIFRPADTVVIGDTPKDIACAHAVGARCIAVATGRFSADELRRAGADEVVETLEEI